MYRALVTSVATLFVATGLSRAQTVEGSVGKVPADALFYASSLRAGEQIDAFMKSKAYAQLRAMPAAKHFYRELMKEVGKPENPLGQAMRFLHAPDNADLHALLLDLLRTEFFVYGGEDTIKLLQLGAEMSFSSRFDRLLARARRAQDPDGAVRNALETVAENLDKVVAPDVVIGFRVANPAVAKSQFDRLDKLVKKQLEQAPKEIGQLYQRTKIGDAEALVVKISGAMIPPDKLNLEQYEEEKGQYKALAEKLRSMNLTVTLALKGEYVLLSLGATPGPIEKFGAGEALITLAEFAPLRKAADKRICGIDYGSKKLSEMLGTSAKDIEEMMKAGADALNDAPISDELRKKIAADLEKLGKDLVATIPPPAASMGFAFLSGQGVEGFDYVYHDAKVAPLTILDNLGGSPVAFLAERGGDATPTYQLFVKWIKIMYGHGLAVAKEMADENQFDQIQNGMNMAVPHWQRFDELTGGLLLPALADGQQAVVLDGKWTSKNWSPGLDQKGQELPMLEFGMVFSLSDSGKLMEAFQGYRKFVNDLLGIARGFGAPIPEEGWPKPRSTEAGKATALYWPLPDLGQDKSFVPNFAVSKNLLTVSLSTQHAARLHEASPVATEVKKFAGGNPIIGASWFDHTALIKLARPWVETLGVPALEAEAKANNPEGLRPQDVAPQIKTAFDVLGCIKNYVSVTYVENGATVTHSRTTVEDIK